MKKYKILDIKFMKFLIVGVGNTILSAIIMFLLYNLIKAGYWVSSSISYLIASCFSFYLNKKFTFKNDGKIVITALKFSINVAVCYVLAYSVAKPLVVWWLTVFNCKMRIVEQLAMVVGMCLFTTFNYIGQRFYAFR